MNDREALDAYFDICKRIFEQMERDSTWPWPSDSTNSEDSIESPDTNSDA